MGQNYLYSSGEAEIRFDFKAPASGRFEIRLAYQPHENRGSQVPVSVITSAAERELAINMKQPPPLKGGFISLGEFDLRENEPGSVTLSTRNAGGLVHADAVQIVRSNE